MAKAQKVLNVPFNMMLLLAVMGGYNYATRIAKEFKIKQPVITRELIHLKRVGLLKPLRPGYFSLSK